MDEVRKPAIKNDLLIRTEESESENKSKRLPGFYYLSASDRYHLTHSSDVQRRFGISEYHSSLIRAIRITKHQFILKIGKT